MIKVTREDMRAKIIGMIENGLTNKEIAIKLSNDFGANEKNRMSAADVAELKDALGLKGIKPKKKKLYELVDSIDEVLPVNHEEADRFEAAVSASHLSNELIESEDVDLITDSRPEGDIFDVEFENEQL